MSKAEKILEKMRQNPRDWRIDDLYTVARAYGVDWRRQGTSHVTFRLPLGNKLTVPAHRPIKPIYIKQFVAFIATGNGE